MEFYQGLGHKTGVMPLNEREMYLFHIRPEPVRLSPDPDRLHALLAERLQSYGGVAADVRDALSPESQITYSRLEPLFVEDAWSRVRVVFGGDAAHTYPPHMTQGAATALEDGLVLADELSRGGLLEDSLAAYVARRRDRCRYVYEFANEMLADEQAIRTSEDLGAARSAGLGDLDARLTTADRIVDEYELGASAAASRA